MKKRFLLFLLALTLLLPSALAEPAPSDNALLYLAFDEGQGTVVQDRSGNLTDADIEYQYLVPAFTVPMEPQWRKIGVAGGSLLFDGCSTCISYAPEEITVSGNALTISVWIAPRAYPNVNTRCKTVADKIHSDKHHLIPVKHPDAHQLACTVDEDCGLVEIKQGKCITKGV